MTTGLQTVINPVKDLSRATALFGQLLGAEPIMDEPYHVGLRVAGQDVGLDPHGYSRGVTGPLGYWNVDAIAESVAQLVDAGATEQQAVTDVGGGKLIATVADADGNLIGLVQPS